MYMVPNTKKLNIMNKKKLKNLEKFAITKKQMTKIKGGGGPRTVIQALSDA